MSFRAVSLPAIVLLTLCAPAAAGPAVDAATRAEALIVEGKPVEALAALAEAEAALWEWAPLAFRKVAFVTSFDGFGEYQERADAPFRPDEEMMIYMEPIGFGYGGSGDQAGVDFSIDLAVENTTGQVVIESEDLFQISADTQPDQRDLAVTVTLAAPYMRPGDYKAVFTVNDEHADKTGAFEVPFTLAPPAAETASAPK